MEDSLTSICEELQAMCDHSLGPPIASSSGTTNFKLFALKILQLKNMNRSIFLNLDQKKTSVEKKKEKVGNAQLTLENLLYKQSYLLREIKICDDYLTPETRQIEQETQTQILIQQKKKNLKFVDDKMEEQEEDLTSSSQKNIKEQHKESLLILESELKHRQYLETVILEKETILKQNQEILQKKRKLVDDFPVKVKALKTLADEMKELFPREEKVIVSDNTLDLSRNLPNPLFILFRSFHSSLHSTDISLTIVPTAQSVQSFIGNWAVELTLTQSTLLPHQATPATAQVTFLFTYHPILDLILVQVSSLSISSFQKGNSFLFKKSDSARCLLPSYLRKPSFFTGTLEAGLGTPEMWAQWIAGLRPLPTPDSEGSFLSTASLISLVNSFSPSHSLSYSLSFRCNRD
jgi:hypothetical protein